MKNENYRVRISSSAPLKPAVVAGFNKNNKNSVSFVSAFNFRKPVIVKAKSGWYIKYYFRIPVNLREAYGGKTWHRFRIKEDLNRRKGDEREEYAYLMRDSLEQSLRMGYNPFTEAVEIAASESLEEKKELGATDAILLFLETWNKRGLEPASMVKYQRTATRLMQWLQKKHIPHRDIQEITQDNIEQFLNDLKKEKKFSNREYNNTYDFTRTIFNFLLKKKYISESPCAGIDKQKTKSTKHRYYDEKSLKDITSALEINDPYTLFAFYTVYYLCVRSEKELKNLKVGNIKWEESKLLVEVGKGNTEGYIPMDDHIKELFLKEGIDKYPDDYYIFSIEGKPSQKPFGNNFFNKRFRKARNAAGLSKDFSLYGAKHSRIIHLKQDGLDDASIMALTRHKDFSAYARYLRDLGMDANPERINKVSRKI